MPREAPTTRATGLVDVMDTELMMVSLVIWMMPRETIRLEFTYKYIYGLITDTNGDARPPLLGGGYVNYPNLGIPTPHMEPGGPASAPHFWEHGGKDHVLNNQDHNNYLFLTNIGERHQ